MDKIVRFVLEGSPCSGKSETLRYLQTCKSEIPVVFVEEAATEILREDPDFVKRDPSAFQAEVLRRQYLREEEALSALQKADGMLGVIILDRGAADTFVYLNEERAQSITGVSVETLVLRYDAVLHFDPYIETHSLKSGNDLRAETDTDELLALHEKSLRVWRLHPRFENVPVFQTKAEKGRYVAERINAQLKTTVFSRK